MNPYQRLVSLGMNPECARETVFWYMAQGDDDGLEKYVEEVERNAISVPSVSGSDLLGASVS